MINYVIQKLFDLMKLKPFILNIIIHKENNV